MKTINECFENIPAKGIFFYLDNFNVPWQGLNNQLDTLYHLSHSGEKLASRFLKNLCDNDTGYITEENATTLANALYQMYKYKWEKLYNSMQLEYNPIQNYNLEEVEEINQNTSTESNSTNTDNSESENTLSITDTSTANLQTAKSGTDTVAESGESTNTNDFDGKITNSGTNRTETYINKTEEPHTTISENSDIYNSVYGFNSVETVGRNVDVVGKTTQNDGMTTTHENDTQTTTPNLLQKTENDTTEHFEKDFANTTTYNNRVTETGTNTFSRESENSSQNSQTVTGENTTSGTLSNERTLSRTGSIGGITFQQMIEQERLIGDFEFFEAVFDDIDNYLSLKIYI